MKKASNVQIASKNYLEGTFTIVGNDTVHCMDNSPSGIPVMIKCGKCGMVLRQRKGGCLPCQFKAQGLL